MGSLGLEAQLICHGAVHTYDPDMGLVGQTNEMGKNTDLRPVGLHLAKHNI